MVSNLTVGDKMKQKILNSKESKKGKERTKDRWDEWKTNSMGCLGGSVS